MQRGETLRCRYSHCAPFKSRACRDVEAGRSKGAALRALHARRITFPRRHHLLALSQPDPQQVLSTGAFQPWESLKLREVSPASTAEEVIFRLESS